MATAPTWTDERVERLKKEWAKGHSAAVIAARMGISRNSVISKVHRIGLPKRRTTTSALGRVGAPKSKPVFDATPTGKWMLIPPKVKQMRQLVKDMKAADAEPIPAKGPGVPLLDLEWNDCRWPVNSPARGEDMLFCGHQKCDGSSYCAEHEAISRERAPTRRRILPDPQRRAA